MSFPADRVVVVAASADGIQAVSRTLGALPVGFPAAILIVQHRSGRGASVLARILARRTSLPVRDAVDGEPLASGVVYLAPADRHLLVKPDRTLSFSDGRKIRHLLSSANPLFASAALSIGPRLIAVVLTGSGFDATDGVQAVKAAGGVVIAQDPATSKFPSMPASAVATGAVDLVLPIEEIGPALQRLVTPSLPSPDAKIASR